MNRIFVVEREVIVGLQRESDGIKFIFRFDVSKESLFALRKILKKMVMNGELKWKEATDVIIAADRELAKGDPDDCGDEGKRE